MKKVSVVEIYSKELCRKERDKLFVFGDNLVGTGTGGQAIIRLQLNSFGIPTKRLPSMDSNAFFSDLSEEFDAVDRAIDHLVDIASDVELVFPKGGLGTGLAKMKESSPELFDHMNRRLLEEFGFDNLTGTLV